MLVAGCRWLVFLILSSPPILFLVPCLQTDHRSLLRQEEGVSLAAGEELYRVGELPPVRLEAQRQTIQVGGEWFRVGRWSLANPIAPLSYGPMALRLSEQKGGDYNSYE